MTTQEQETHAGLAIIAGLGLEIGKHIKEALREDRREAGLFRNPLLRKVGPASQNGAYIDLGAPNEGRIWELKRLVVIDNDPWTTDTGGQAAICAGMMPLGVGSSTVQVSMSDLMTQGINIPFLGAWGRHELVVYRQNRLYLVINGGSGVVSAVGLVYEFDADPFL